MLKKVPVTPPWDIIQREYPFHLRRGGQSSRSDEDQICDSSKETCSTGSLEQEAIDRFEKWLDKHDLPKNKLKVRGTRVVP